MTFTDREVADIYAALDGAIMNEESYVQCHEIGWGKDGSRVVPRGYVGLVKRCRSKIRRWQKLKDKIAKVRRC